MNDAPDQVAAVGERVTAVRDRLAVLPRFALLDGPTPLQSASALAAALDGLADAGGPAWLGLKREDLAPVGSGGNKLRNLEFLVGGALAEGADTLVTAGRRWSNHCRLTAAAGARAGLAVEVVLSGPPTDPPNPGRVLCELLGATVHQAATGDREEREALVGRAVANLRARGRKPYVVPVGGSGMPGVLGQVLAAGELAGQAAAAAIAPDVVVVPTATGGTQAGLIAGLSRAWLSRAGLSGGGSPTRVIGIAVAHPSDALRPAIEASLAALDATDLAAAIDIDDRWLGGGYGVTSPAADEATRLLAGTQGVLVDPIYTAKALAGLVGLIRSGELDGGTAVFWHAGGLPGIFEPLEG